MGLSAKQLDSLHGLSDTEQVQYESGAVRSADAEDVRYDLISPFGLERLARTYAEGAAKYSDHNWRKGMPVSVMINHAMRHVVLYLRGDRAEDHLAHAAWNLFAVMEFEATRPELLDLFEFPVNEQPVDLAESDEECQCEQCEPKRRPGAVHVKSPEFMTCRICGDRCGKGSQAYWRVLLTGHCCPGCESTTERRQCRACKGWGDPSQPGWPELKATGICIHCEPHVIRTTQAGERKGETMQDLKRASAEANLAELNQERSDRAQS